MALYTGRRCAIQMDDIGIPLPQATLGINSALPSDAWSKENINTACMIAMVSLSKAAGAVMRDM